MDHVFFSYSSDDRHTVDRYAKALKDNGIDVWIDHDHIGPGFDLPDTLKRQVEDCCCFVVFYSENSYNSTWVKREAEHARNNGKPIIPVKIDNKNYTGWWTNTIGDYVFIHAAEVGEEKATTFLINGAKLFYKKLAPVICIANFKGGVGKTTVAAQVSAAIHKILNNRCLLIDLDPQHNLTQLFLNRETADHKAGLDQSVMSLFELSRAHGEQYSPARDWRQVNTSAFSPPPIHALKHTIFQTRASTTPCIDLIPGQIDLAKYALNQSEHYVSHCADAFKRSISQYRNDYDLIILDTNPSISFLSEIAIGAASYVLSPIKPDRFSLRGLRLLRKVLDTLYLKDSDVERGILLNAVRKNDNQQDIIVNLLMEGSYDEPSDDPPDSALVLKNSLPESGFLRLTNPTIMDAPAMELVPFQSGHFYLPNIQNRLNAVAWEIIKKLDIPHAHILTSNH